MTLIQACCLGSKPTKRKSNQPWFDQQCASLKSDKYKLLRKFRISYSEENPNAYLRARNLFKQKCAEKKAEYQAMKLDDLISSVNDQKSFWSKLKKMTNKSVRAGNVSNEEWERHF